MWTESRYRVELCLQHGLTLRILTSKSQEEASLVFSTVAEALICSCSVKLWLRKADSLLGLQPPVSVASCGGESGRTRISGHIRMKVPKGTILWGSSQPELAANQFHSRRGRLTAPPFA